MHEVRSVSTNSVGFIQAVSHQSMFSSQGNYNRVWSLKSEGPLILLQTLFHKEIMCLSVHMSEVKWGRWNRIIQKVQHWNEGHVAGRPGLSLTVAVGDPDLIVEMLVWKQNHHIEMNNSNLCWVFPCTPSGVHMTHNPPQVTSGVPSRQKTCYMWVHHGLWNSLQNTLKWN